MGAARRGPGLGSPNNSTLIRGDVAEEVAKRKQQPGGSILVAGSRTLVHTLMRDTQTFDSGVVVHTHHPNDS